MESERITLLALFPCNSDAKPRLRDLNSHFWTGFLMSRLIFPSYGAFFGVFLLGLSGVHGLAAQSGPAQGSAFIDNQGDRVASTPAPVVSGLDHPFSKLAVGPG